MYWELLGYSAEKRTTFRTWGLERLGRRELELRLPGLSISKAKEILGCLADSMVIHGQQFRSGSCLHDIITTPIYVMETPSIELPGPDVFRVVLPDATGKWPWEDGCHPMFRLQLEPAEIQQMLKLISDGGGATSDG